MKRLIVCIAVFLACSCALPTSNAAPLPTLGVASIATLTDRTAGGYRAEDAAIRGIGASWIRIVMNWNETEMLPGQYSWTRLDAAVAQARAANLQILGLIAGPPPAWAGTVPLSNGSTPRNAADYGNFARQLALRYRDSVRAWEIWNEPNIGSYWIAPNAAAYVSVLRSAYQSIKSVSPSSTVLSGGLSSDAGGIAPTAFVNQLYAAGGGAFLDAVALHPYTFPHPARLDPLGRENSIAEIRSVMDRNGQAGKRIWITEWGQSTGTGPTSVDEGRQASIITSSLDFFATQRGLGPVFLFTTKDWSRDRADTELNYGLYRFDYSPKPVVAQLRQRYG